MYDKKEKTEEKIKELDFSRKQNERHLYEQEMKKRIKENTKNQYSQVYNQMIEERKIK